MLCEARDCWGPGVFLDRGPMGDQPLTLRVAHWAGGIGSGGRGDPPAVKTAGLSRLAELVQKAVCTQAVYECGEQGIPLAAPGDPVHLKPLIRCLPGAVKMHVQNLKEKITQAIDHNTRNHGQRRQPVFTWGELLQEIAIYGRDMGWLEEGTNL